MGRSEIWKVRRLEWEVFKRYGGRVGRGRERKEGDDGEDVGLCGGRGVRVPCGVDWEFAGEARCQRAKEYRNGSGLLGSSAD